MMKRMGLKQTKEILVSEANNSRKHKYLGDAADAMFKFYVLELVERVVVALEKRRKPTAYNLFCGKHLKKGLAFPQIAELWKSQKPNKMVVCDE